MAVGSYGAFGKTPAGYESWSADQQVAWQQSQQAQTGALIGSASNALASIIGSAVGSAKGAAVPSLASYIPVNATASSSTAVATTPKGSKSFLSKYGLYLAALAIVAAAGGGFFLFKRKK